MTEEIRQTFSIMGLKVPQIDSLESIITKLRIQQRIFLKMYGQQLKIISLMVFKKIFKFHYYKS